MAAYDEEVGSWYWPSPGRRNAAITLPGASRHEAAPFNWEEIGSNFAPTGGFGGGTIPNLDYGLGGDQGFADMVYDLLLNPSISPFQGRMEESMGSIMDILLSGGADTGWMGAYEPTAAMMRGNLRRSAADMGEMFGNYGTGVLEGTGEVMRRGTQDINSLLGNLSFAAREGAAGRQATGVQALANLLGALSGQESVLGSQGAGQLANMLYGSQEAAANRMYGLIPGLMGQQNDILQMLFGMGTGIQGIEQEQLQTIYQDWLREIQGLRPEMMNLLGIPTPIGYEGESTGWIENLLPILAALPWGDMF